MGTTMILVHLTKEHSSAFLTLFTGADADVEAFCFK